MHAQSGSLSFPKDIHTNVCRECTSSAPGAGRAAFIALETGNGRSISSSSNYSFCHRIELRHVVGVSLTISLEEAGEGEHVGEAHAVGYLDYFGV